MGRRLLLVTGLVWAVGLAACGSIDTRATVEQITNARIAVESAEKIDAKAYAPENLRHAQDALAIANDAYANKEFDRAFEFAKKATIYGRVAKAQTEYKKTEEKLKKKKAELEKIRQQTQALMGNNAMPAVTAPAATAVPTAVPAQKEAN